jgi:uncharacterized membrane protein
MSAAVSRPASASSAVQPARLYRSAYAVGVLAVTTGALLLRTVKLGQLPIWRDEAFTGLVERDSWGGMLDAVRQDSAPPLNYLLTHIVAQVSTAPTALRLLPALVGTAAVPIGAALARRVGGDRAGLFGAAATALAPPLVLASRDARMYALATTLVLAAALLLLHALERPTPGRLCAYGVCVTLAVYTSYFAVLAVLAQLLAALLLRPSRMAWRRAALATAAGMALLAPWLVAASAQFQHAEVPFWVKPVTGWILQDVTRQLRRGPDIDNTHPFAQTVQGVAIWASVIAAAALVWQLRRAAPVPRRAAGYLGAAGIGAALLFTLISLARPLFEPRYLTIFWAMLVPLVGAGAAALRPRIVGAAVIGVLGVCSIAVVSTMIRPDWSVVSAYLDAHVGENDQVAIDSPDYLLILYHSQPAMAARSHIVSRQGPPWFWGVAAYPPGAVQSKVVDKGGTIYVFVNNFENLSFLPPGYHPGERWCLSGTDFCIVPYRR